MSVSNFTKTNSFITESFFRRVSGSRLATLLKERMNNRRPLGNFDNSSPILYTYSLIFAYKKKTRERREHFYIHLSFKETGADIIKDCVFWWCHIHASHESSLNKFVAQNKRDIWYDWLRRDSNLRLLIS